MLCFRAPRVLRSDESDDEEDEVEQPSSSGRGAGASMPAALEKVLTPPPSSPRGRPRPGRVVRLSSSSTPPPSPDARSPGRRRASLNGGAPSPRPHGGAPSPRAAAPAPPPATPRRDANGRCDKCDGDHDTDLCPIYKKPRESHPDATRRRPVVMGASGGNFQLHSARVIRQPGDGNCLFHALAFGLGAAAPHGGAAALRRELAEWVATHPGERIADTPLSDWVSWDSGESCRQYAERMARAGAAAAGAWGGGIEMAACARLKRVNVHVYERKGLAGGFKRISCFDAPGAEQRGAASPARGSPAAPPRTVHVLYCGGVHYDALQTDHNWEQRL